MSQPAEETAPPPPKRRRYQSDSYGERLLYLVVAVIWWYCITEATDPLGAGGSASRRDLHKYQTLALAASPFLVLAASTSRATTLGYIARWLALGGTIVSGAAAMPLLAFFVMWLLAVIIGMQAGGEVFQFFGAVLALGVAAAVLVKAVATPQHREI